MATSTTNENIPNLAVGDVFNAGDYEVTVTFLEKGSQALGWTGAGMVDQNLIAGVKIPMSVVFENIKINSCYQYYNRGENGAVVRSKFDASWGNVVDADILVTLFQGMLVDIRDLLLNFPTDVAKIQQKLDELAELKKKYQSSDLSDSFKLENIKIIDEVSKGLACLKGELSPGSPNSRISSMNSDCNLEGILDNAENTLKNSVVNPYNGDVFDKNGFVSGESTTGKNIIIKYTRSGKVKYDLLADYYDNTKNDGDPDHIIPIRHVAIYYADQLELTGKGVTFGIGKSYQRPDEKGIDIAFFNDVDKTIRIAINMPSNTISKSNNKIATLKNSLIHEFEHYNDFQLKRDKNSPLIHADVCFRQIKHATFKEMDESDQDNVFKYLLGFLNDYWTIERNSTEITKVFTSYNEYFKKNNKRSLYFNQDEIKIKKL